MSMLKLSILLASLLSVAVTLLGCAYGQKIAVNSNLEITPMSTPTPLRIVEVEPIAGAKAFRNDNGWEIPKLDSKDVKENSYIERSKDGRAVHVLIKDQTLRPAIKTDEPSVVVESSTRRLELMFAREYSVDSHPFCYRFQATRVTVDNSNHVTGGGGVVFFFSYFDEDGDGKFETLLLDEKDSKGEVSFDGRPHLPTWILNL